MKSSAYNDVTFLLVLFLNRGRDFFSGQEVLGVLQDLF